MPPPGLEAYPNLLHQAHTSFLLPEASAASSRILMTLGTWASQPSGQSTLMPPPSCCLSKVLAWSPDWGAKSSFDCQIKAWQGSGQARLANVTHSTLASCSQQSSRGWLLAQAMPHSLRIKVIAVLGAQHPACKSLFVAQRKGGHPQSGKARGPSRWGDRTSG